jgi:hypothetical protein
MYACLCFSVSFLFLTCFALLSYSFFSAAAALAAAQNALTKNSVPSAPPRRTAMTRQQEAQQSLGGSRSAMKMFMNTPRTLQEGSRQQRDAPTEDAQPPA